VAGADVGQPTAAAANPSNAPRGNARGQGEIRYITSYDRPGCDERPAPDHTTRYHHGTRTQRSALPHDHAKSFPVLRALDLAGDIHRTRIQIVSEHGSGTDEHVVFQSGRLINKRVILKLDIVADDHSRAHIRAAADDASAAEPSMLSYLR
jgi:hypothetical protein